MSEIVREQLRVLLTIADDILYGRVTSRKERKITHDKIKHVVDVIEHEG